MQPRDHHYYFAHAYFKHLVFDNPQYVFDSLKSKNKNLLVNFWYQVPKVIHPNKKEMHIILPVGLNHCFYESENNNILLVQMPTPEFITEVNYIGVVFRNQDNTIRYFTLEKTMIFDAEEKSKFAESFIFCEWTQTTHINLMTQINPPTKETFLKAIKHEIQI